MTEIIKKIENVFIPGDVPSLKNSKIITRTGGVHRSKACSAYLRSLGVQDYNANKQTVKGYKRRINMFRYLCKNKFADIAFPAKIGFHFVRKTRRRFDYINMMQIILDLMTAHNFIPDDDMHNVIPVIVNAQGGTDEGAFWSLDASAPGVRVFVL